MSGRSPSLHDETPGSASPLTRADPTDAAVTTTAFAATAVVVLRWLVPLCFVC